MIAMMFQSAFVHLARTVATERHRLSIFNADFSSLSDVKGGELRAMGLFAKLGDAAFKNGAVLGRPVGRVPGTRALIPQFSADVETAGPRKAGRGRG